MAGKARQGLARPGEAWHGRRGAARLGAAGQGSVGHGRQGWVRSGRVWHGKAWQAWIGNTTTQQRKQAKTMDLNELNRAATTSGGKWVKLRTKEDGSFEGTLVAFESRPRTDMEGNVVMKRGTDTPRTEWLLTLSVPLAEREGPEDDGTRKMPCNEAMQSAISQAIKACGEPAKEGDTLKIAVSADPADKMRQATYVARWTPGKPIIDIAEF
jgi:hypothetical protein